MNNIHKNNISQQEIQKISFLIQPSTTIFKNIKMFLSDPLLLYGLVSYLNLILELAHSGIPEIRFSHDWYAHKLSISPRQIIYIENFLERHRFIEKLDNGKWTYDKTKPRTIRISGIFILGRIRNQLRDLFKSLWVSPENLYKLNENPCTLDKIRVDRYSGLKNRIPIFFENQFDIDIWGEPPKWLETNWAEPPSS